MNAKHIARVRQAAIERFTMHHGGIHGPSHWERVRENGLYLASESGADTVVVELFAYLHDCCRESDGFDPEHGLRASQFARSCSGGLILLDPERLELLCYACEHHEKGRTSEDPTVGTCWDSDRLDLGRVGIRPNPKFLSTERARRKSVISRAYRRSRGEKLRLKH